uniref:tRNA uridine 5-carboxymethylaminomethyl modification enzyme C-terminal subdomain domain-containing protein n=1 Tax=Strigamia maritima TaxID=126957 RepID=T1J2K5_STRMM
MLCHQFLQIGGRSSFFSVRNCSKISYDVVVVGGGHAGTEAAAAAARMGNKTLLVTHKPETIGEMSCNPSFGGIGKGHLMREIDALDGVCARICDKSGIQYKGYRAQIDRKLYKKNIQEEIRNTKNLEITSAAVEDLIINEKHDGDSVKRMCEGIVLDSGSVIHGKTVILTTGTFLGGEIYIGMKTWPAGRIGDKPSIGLVKTLHSLNFNLGRLRTGTPPRLEKSSINFDNLEASGGDIPPLPFSFMNRGVDIKPEDQLKCHLVRTNSEVEKIILDNLHLSKHIKEEVHGPRYCPSLESKAARFPGRIHQIWLEPEGFDSNVIYPNGLACTIPEEQQFQLLRCIPAFNNVIMLKPGYGVHYSFIDPKQIKPTLETRSVKNLYFAGQINGTTGYEEAAAQGIIAGINAGCKVQNKEPFTISRTEGYIGVLIDDLTTLGATEPYRMFTSRAEFRLYLRPDNADLRLTEKAFPTGCVSNERMDKVIEIKNKLIEAENTLRQDKRSMNDWWKIVGREIKSSADMKNAYEVLGVDEISIEVLVRANPEKYGFLSEDHSLATRVKIEALYRLHVLDQQDEINEIKQDEEMELPEDIDYFASTVSLSNEARQRLSEFRPPTIAAASRIPGVTPAAILNLLRYVRKSSKTQTLNVI